MAKKIEQQEKPNPKVRLVYIGPCTTTDQKLGGMFLPITEEQLREKRLPETLPQERVYGGKIPEAGGASRNDLRVRVQVRQRKHGLRQHSAMGGLPRQRSSCSSSGRPTTMLSLPLKNWIGRRSGARTRTSFTGNWLRSRWPMVA